MFCIIDQHPSNAPSPLVMWRMYMGCEIMTEPDHICCGSSSGLQWRSSYWEKHRADVVCKIFVICAWGRKCKKALNYANIQRSQFSKAFEQASRCQRCSASINNWALYMSPIHSTNVNAQANVVITSGLGQGTEYTQPQAGAVQICSSCYLLRN